MTDPSTPDVVPRARALAILRDDRDRIWALCDRLPAPAMVTPGLGGGAWSPADLLGHLESWEEHALAAIDAWNEGRQAPIDAALTASGVDAVNAAEVERKAGRDGVEARRSAEATHAALLARLEATSDAAWSAPAGPREPAPFGDLLGRILAGVRDPFLHDIAHLPDLERFVEVHGEPGAIETKP